MVNVFGRKLKIIPCGIVEELWGGRPDEFGDRLVPKGRFGVYNSLYKRGLHVTTYLSLLDDLFPNGTHSYEDVFRLIAIEHPSLLPSLSQRKLFN
ncbi:hypothetical protein HY214_01695 [Candidatus Roizmanbacteria bacterium]|nr:hypothetical protein [Candidatus Roizmanbacteria bacterium]